MSMIYQFNPLMFSSLFPPAKASMRKQFLDPFYRLSETQLDHYGQLHQIFDFLPYNGSVFQRCARKIITVILMFDPIINPAYQNLAHAFMGFVDGIMNLSLDYPYQNYETMQRHYGLFTPNETAFTKISNDLIETHDFIQTHSPVENASLLGCLLREHGLFSVLSQTDFDDILNCNGHVPLRRRTGSASFRPTRENSRGGMSNIVETNFPVLFTAMAERIRSMTPAPSLQNLPDYASDPNTMQARPMHTPPHRRFNDTPVPPFMENSSGALSDHDFLPVYLNNNSPNHAATNFALSLTALMEQILAPSEQVRLGNVPPTPNTQQTRPRHNPHSCHMNAGPVHPSI